VGKPDRYYLPDFQLTLRPTARKDKKGVPIVYKPGSVVEFLGAKSAHCIFVNGAQGVFEVRLDEVLSVTPPPKVEYTQESIHSRNALLESFIAPLDPIQNQVDVTRTRRDEVAARRKSLEKPAPTPSVSPSASLRKTVENARRAVPKIKKTPSKSKCKRKDSLIDSSSESSSELGEQDPPKKKKRLSGAASRRSNAPSTPMPSGGEGMSEFLNFNNTKMSGFVMMMTPDLAKSGYKFDVTK
jgi:hypothetical protein